jgi:hypothetical protein
MLTSPNYLPARAARPLGELVASSGFRNSACEAENGFVADEIHFFRRCSEETIREKTQRFQWVQIRVNPDQVLSPIGENT